MRKKRISLITMQAIKVDKLNNRNIYRGRTTIAPQKAQHYRLYDYNKCRGVETTGIHRYRHTFAKQWILNGGNVVSLSKLLGHSSLDITQNYINLLVSDIAKQVDEFNVLDKFYNKSHLSL